MPIFSDNPDAWDSYHTLIDECPAAISLDFAIGEHAPYAERTDLLAVLIHMNEPGEHGMGEGRDPEALRHVEQSIVHAYESKLDAVFVGRVRSQGVWQLYFYSVENDETEERAAELLSGFSGWEQELHIRSDPEWEMYFELLFPDRERLQWLQDRNVCEALARGGDSLVVPRKVDHFAYFSTAEDRQNFIDVTANSGYEVEEIAFSKDDEELGYGLQFSRTDSVELDEIHDVVMDLVTLAAENEGVYEGWETNVLVVKPSDNLPN